MISVLFENPKRDINVSTIARTCEFFGVDFYITKPAKLSIKASGGVIKHKKPKIINLKDWQGRIVITDSKYKTNPKDFKFRNGDLIVFGNEATGVSQEAKHLASARIGLESKGCVPCLNVASAVASILALILIK